MRSSTSSSSAFSASYTGTPRSVIKYLSAAGMPYVTPEPTTSASANMTSSTLDTVATSTATVQHHIAAETSRKGLDTAAAAGIGVGATLGVVVLMSIVMWMFWRRRQRQRGNIRIEEEDAVGDAKLDDAETPDSEKDIEILRFTTEKDGPEKYEAPDTSPTTVMVEAGGHGRVELAGHQNAAELDGGWRPAEVPGSKTKGEKG